MNTKKDFKWLFKSAAYTVSVNLLTLIVMLLYAQNIVRDVTSLICLFVIYIISTILFAYIKGESAHPLLYNLSVLLIHIVLNIIIMFVLGYFYTGWENAMFYWTRIFTLIFIVVVLLFDTILSLIRK